jgi:NADH:ubiquinone oxidoreductase subunit 5 (subunit L)/multisubunit Na+/H+ antiporter MnhA subunit
MPDPIHLALAVAISAPLLGAVLLGLLSIAREERPTERFTTTVLEISLVLSLLGALGVALRWAGVGGAPFRGEAAFGDWLRLGSYYIPAVTLVDVPAVALGLLGAVLTLLVARFSRTYLHKDPGFLRFFVLLALFASGVQLVAYAGALDVMFAGWELIGISSALFIGFFHERAEPIRSSVRAFTTYRLCDAGFLMAMVAVYEVLGTTRLAALPGAAALPAWESTTIAALFLLAAMGKSAMLPFSGWLPRAMEGPTPSSALFYGGISIHMGLYLMLRVHPVLDAAPMVEIAGVVIGIATALYASAVARTHSDAKGTLAHATLAQAGLILAEISLGLTTFATIHLACHAMLRVFQYLRTPNALHDAHRLGHSAIVHPHAPVDPTMLARRRYVAALHRLRLEDLLDALVTPVIILARTLDSLDHRFRRTGRDTLGVAAGDTAGPAEDVR